jgi:hypothetical protein
MLLNWSVRKPPFNFQQDVQAHVYTIQSLTVHLKYPRKWSSHVHHTPGPFSLAMNTSPQPDTFLFNDNRCRAKLFQARYTPLISGFWSVIVHCTMSRHFQPSPLPQIARISGMRVKQQSTFPSIEISIVCRGSIYGLESSVGTRST